MSMDAFDRAFQNTMREEGGFVLHDVEGDRGGMTYAGIARNAWPDWRGWQEIDAGREPDEADIAAWYRPRFWDPISGDELPPALAPAIYDCAVNCGVGTASRLLQQAINDLGYAEVRIDSRIGPRTLAAVWATDDDELLIAYAWRRRDYYRAIAERSESQIKFLKGWQRRAARQGRPLEGLR